MKKIFAILMATGLMTSAALAAEFTEVDADKSGAVSMDEAKAAMPELTAEAFNAADADRNGELSAEEFANIKS